MTTTMEDNDNPQHPADMDNAMIASLMPSPLAMQLSSCRTPRATRALMNY